MRTLKKSLLLLFTVFTLAAVFCFGASALSSSGSCGGSVTYTYNSETKELVISGTGAMYDYDYLDAKSPFYDSDIKSVVIKNSVTTIGYQAFYYCTNLQSVTIGNSVTTIGSYAFRRCDSLQSVTIPDSVTTIESYAFYYCTSLQSVTIGNSVTTIGSNAFYWCESLNDVYYKGTKAQWEKISIGSYNSSLTGATIHYHYNNNHNEIDMEAVGSTCTEIGYTAGKYCPDCETWLEGHEEIPAIGHTDSDGDSWCDICDEYCLSKVRSTGQCGENVIYKWYEDGMLVISGAGAMTDYSYYNRSPFNWSGMKSVVIKSGVTTIGDCAFYNCDSLQSVTIPDNVTTIGDYAFFECDSLQSVTIPDSVTTIGERAFDDCDNLKDVYYTGTQTQWQNIAIGDFNSYLTNANIHYNHTHSYTSVVTTNPTCTKTGTKTYTCICGDTYTETISAKAHTYKTTTTKATTTQNGKSETVCTSCGNVKSSKTLYAVTDFSLSETKYVYTGNNKTPTVIVKDSKGNKLVKNTDYKLTVSSKRSGIGKHKVVVTLIGNYSGTKNLYFYILPNKVKNFKSSAQTSSTVTLKWDSVPGAVGYTVYRYSPSKKAYVKAGTTTGTTFKVSKLLTATKYTFKIVCYGTASTGKGYNCDGYTLLKTATCTATPTISAKSTAKGKVALTWTNVSGETGYQVYYSTQKSSGYTKIGNYGANVTALNGSKLSSNYTYYFKVRAYIKTDSGYVYSPFSAVKGIKIK